MIYLIHGTDREKVKAKATTLIESLVAKKPDASRGQYTADTFSPEMLDQLVGGQGLFVARLIIELDTLVSGDSTKKSESNTELKATILENLERFASSDNIFIFREGKLLKAELAKFEKHAEKIQEYAQSEHEQKNSGRFGQAQSPFALADAFGRRDKKMLWKLYVEQLASGSVAEELHGLLFWQLKAMILAQASPSATAAGLKPFVYGKAKQSGANFSTEELRALSSRFVSIYHDAHRGLSELHLLLEQTILEL